MFPIIFALAVLLYFGITEGWAGLAWIAYGLGIAWAFYSYCAIPYWTISQTRWKAECLGRQWGRSVMAGIVDLKGDSPTKDSARSKGQPVRSCPRR